MCTGRHHSNVRQPQVLRTCSSYWARQPKYVRASWSSGRNATYLDCAGRTKTKFTVWHDRQYEVNGTGAMNGRRLCRRKMARPVHAKSLAELWMGKLGGAGRTGADADHVAYARAHATHFCNVGLGFHGAVSRSQTRAGRWFHPLQRLYSPTSTVTSLGPTSHPRDVTITPPGQPSPWDPDMEQGAVGLS